MDQSFKRNFLKGSTAATIGTVSTMVFHFGSLMILTRYLSKDEFGIYALILVIVYLFSIFGGFGLEYTLVKFISTDKQEEQKSVLAPIFILRGLSLALVSIIFILSGRFILHFFDERITQYIIYIPILFIITSFRDLLFNLLQALNLFRKLAFIQTASAVLRLAMIFIYLFLHKLNLQNLIFIEMSSSGLSLLLQILTTPMKSLLDFRQNFSSYLRIIKFCTPLYLNNLLTFSYDRVSIFIVGAYLTPISVAYFDVAGRIPDAMKRVFGSFTTVFFPNMAKLFSLGDKRSAELLLNKSLIVFSNVLMLFVLLSFIFSREITGIMFSSRYIDSSLGFSLLMFNFYLRALSNIMGYSLVSAGFASVPVKAGAISSVISIAGSFILIPYFGFMGAIYSTLAMSIVAQVSYTYFMKKADILVNSFEYLKPLIVLTVILIIYYLVHVDSLIVKLITVGVYLAASSIFIKEIKIISQTVMRFIPRFRPN
jgi:O-antigen/teichoic acid export membrane protein